MTDWAKELQKELADPREDGWDTANSIASKIGRPAGTVCHWLKRKVEEGTFETKKHNGKIYYRPREK